MRHLKSCRLTVVSHVVHYAYRDEIWAYGPYAREIDIWADLFGEVVIAAPCRREAPPSDAMAFSRANISMRPQWETGGDALTAKVLQVLWLPLHVLGLARAMRGADAIHVRCPGNLGLLGALLAPLVCPRVVAKYAGQWNGYDGEPWSVRLQRRILASRWWRGPVTVYGQWPNQPAHVISFFTSMMTRQQVNRAKHSALAKSISGPLRILYSGVLTERKRVAALVDAAAALGRRGVRFELAIVGDGIQRAALETRAASLGIADHVRFVGALPFEAVQTWYEWAHCLVLPSRHSEGWPKAVSEAMSHGLICVAVSHGQVPQMLDSRGLLLPEGTPAEIAGALEAIARAPGRFDELRRRAVSWACRFSLEDLRDSLGALLEAHWNLAREGAATGRASRGTQGPLRISNDVSTKPL